jgi:hypothetical protein
MEHRISPSELIVQFGGSYARELGIDLSQGDGMEIQKWFLAALLFGAPISVKTAVKTYREFERAGLVQPETLRNARWNGLVSVLGRGGYTRYDFKTATKLLDVANCLLRNYAGDLNALHHDAADEADLEWRIRQLGKGIGDVTINIFLREMRGIWTKAQPLPSEGTVQAAKALGLVDANRSDRADILQVLTALAREDGIPLEDFPEFEAALVRYGTALRKKRTPRSP